MNNNYKYDEISYAEKIYQSGKFLTKYYPTEMRLLALYCRDVLNMKPLQRKEEIIKFCENSIPLFNVAKYYKIINYAIKKSRDNNQLLIRVEQIDVYKNEIDYIMSLDIQYNYKKILLAFLVQMKLNKYIYETRNKKPYDTLYFKGGRKKYQNIKNMANVPVSLKINEDAIYEMAHNQTGIITLLHSGLIILDFIENCVSNGEVAFLIKDFENVGWYLDYYFQNPKIKLCEKCDNPFYMNSNSQKYCRFHADTYVPLGEKTLTCIDCKENFSVDARNMTKFMCDECQHKRNNKLAKYRMRKYREKI